MHVYGYSLDKSVMRCVHLAHDLPRHVMRGANGFPWDTRSQGLLTLGLWGMLCHFHAAPTPGCLDAATSGQGAGGGQFAQN